VMCDADLRYRKSGWSHHEFRGTRWRNVKKADRQSYLQNAYRVLLTRARQGMVICIPEGSLDDSTRAPEFYDETYKYLSSLGIASIN